MMQKIFLLVAILTISLVCVQESKNSQEIKYNFKEDNQLLILENVTIIDGTGNPPQPSSSLFIEKGKIIRICKKGEIEYPKDAKIIDLNNKFIIPGLFEMHAHMYDEKYHEETCKTLLAFGITTMRIPSIQTNVGVELRKKLASGEILGPRMFTAGKLIDCPESITGGAVIVKTEEEIREIVRQQVEEGVDYIKLYTHLTPNLVKAAIDEAHLHGAKVIGHLGKTSWTYSANAGIDGLHHIAMAGPTWELITKEKRNKFLNLANPTRDFNANLFKEWGVTFDIDGPELKELIKSLTENNVLVDPTLVMMEAMI